MFSSEGDPFTDLEFYLGGLADAEESGNERKGTAVVRFEGSKFSMDELRKLQTAYMAEAKRLQREVVDLEEELEEENTVALRIPNSTLQELRDVLKLEKGDEGMENMHQMQAGLSGVHLTDATTEITSNNPQHIVRLQRLEGSCTGFRFAATFEVQEIQMEREEPDEEEEKDEKDSYNGRRKAVITKLKVEVDRQCLAEMTAFLVDVERRCDLQAFLRGYAEYASWFQHRARAFVHFKKEYPESVSLPTGPSGTLLLITVPDQKGIAYLITWRIHLADSGKASPDVTLSVKSAPEVSAMDTKKTLQRAPEEFGVMVEKMGVEEALGTFLRAVALR